MKHHIYYHMDADGHASAGIIQEFLERTQGKEVSIIFQPINYGMEPHLNLIQRGDAVYMVDYSCQPVDKMLAFTRFCREMNCSLVWIDHHKTAIEEAAKHDELLSIAGIRSDAKAGCELTWDFFNEGRTTNPIISLIADWDMWRKDVADWETMVVYLQTWLRFMRSDPKHSRGFWPKIIQGNASDILEEVSKTGGPLTVYQRQLEDSRMRGFARPGTFAGRSALILNSPQMNSSPFERMIKTADMDVDLMVAWVMNKQGQFSVSLYTQKEGIDLGVLCQKLAEEGPYKSGGGHPKAAGFQTNWEHLSQLMAF
jgi:oligoribonuclease NrnB/cAMP/cGMP phosphodiesterase (DHH superfamily)